MPTIGQAITLQTTVPSAATVSAWGTPVVVGESIAAAKNTPKAFTALGAIATEHGDTSDVYEACRAIFDQGIRQVYTVSMAVDTPGVPSAAEVAAALASLNQHATSKLIQGVVLAGITAEKDEQAAALQTFAEAYDLIFVTTNKAGETVPNIVSQATALASGNGVYLAHAAPATTQDIAAAALGAILAQKPWVSMQWKPIACDVKAVFTPTELATLESGNVNAIMEMGGKTVFSYNLTTSGTAPRWIDITRTKQYLARVIPENVAGLRQKAEKIPYTDLGLEMVKAAIAAPLENLVRQNALAAYQIEIPALADIPPADKEARILQGVEIQATLAGDLQTFAMKLTLGV